ncbi:GspH/FimT family pseudopilin [Paraburkholderia caffeinilytica]|uniref:GspH/FimT family pseudopilin n=1 Tax=Paraburkholderia caffeinilytica TaxID=1761016 RepID=UPI003DA1C440
MRLSACKSRVDTPCTAPLPGMACAGAHMRDQRGLRGPLGPRDLRAGGPKRAAGFTLLEMMVVLVIAGILVSLTALTMTRNPRTDLNEEAQRLALLFESAGDEAQVRARPIAWQPLDGGFRFDQRTEDGWRPLRDDLLGPRNWEGGVTGVAIDYPGSDSHPSRVVFGTEAIDVPVQITLFSAAGRATIVGTGNGRYEVH